MGCGMDVHAIADDYKQVPIVSWSVRAVKGGMLLGCVRLDGDCFRLLTPMGESSEHHSLAAARDAAAALFSPGPRDLN